jgi:hypothetical protein
MGMGTSSGARLVAIFFAIILVTSAFQVAEAGTSTRSRGSNAPVRTASAKHGLDPSNFVVVVIAALILVYGAKVWSRSSPTGHMLATAKHWQSDCCPTLWSGMVLPPSHLPLLPTTRGLSGLRTWTCPRHPTRRHTMKSRKQVGPHETSITASPDAILHSRMA